MFNWKKLQQKKIFAKNNFTEIEIVEKKDLPKNLPPENVFILIKKFNKKNFAKKFFFNKNGFLHKWNFAQKICKKFFCENKNLLKMKLLKKNLPKKDYPKNLFDQK